MLLFIFLYFLRFTSIKGEDICQDSGASRCEECLSVSPDCVWIAGEVPDSISRCTLEINDAQMKIIKGGKTRIELTENQSFRLPGDNDIPGIQVRPQKIQLKLRHGESASFTLSYKALSNYPLDIYYLMDQTFSMEKHLLNLQELSKTLAENLNSLTNNSRIAFGYFSDKVAMPYFAMAPKQLQNPCRTVHLSSGKQCVLGSNFVHVLDFTNDFQKFGIQVQDFAFTANRDDPEGGLDAIMQVLLCDTFGWRMYSRKLIVLASDGLLHTAGGGLLGGFIDPAPKTCKMQKQNNHWVYDGLHADYPSVEEVYHVLIEKKAAILFAIQEKSQEESEKESFVEYYKHLNNLLHEVSFLAVATRDTNNILAVLQAGFRDAVKKVAFNVVNQPSYLKFEAKSTCGTADSNTTWSCYKVELEKEYTFNVTVTLTGQPTKKTETIRIDEMQLHEGLSLEMEYIEMCDCQDEREFDADIHGTFSCGKYNCWPGWVGGKCDQKCDPTIGRYNIEQCAGKTCCGQGEFDTDICKCVCDKGFAGTHCETQCFVDFQGNVCSNHGRCTSKGCICNEGYTNEFCNCSLSRDTCKARGSQVECDNHGVCECGKCKCERTGSFVYKGEFCQFCTGCDSCIYDDVVRRHITGKLDGSQRRAFEFYGIESQSELNCRLQYGPNSTHTCDVHYMARVNSTTIINYYQNCYSNTQMASLVIIGMLMASIVGVGLLGILIWKAQAMIADKRAYATFKNNLKAEQFQSNQLYKSPISHHINPTHQKKAE